jgi:hypothetical protein
MADTHELDMASFCDPGLLPVAAQSAWLVEPLVERARQIVEKTGVSEQKIPEVTSSLHQLFTIFRVEGNSYSDAMAKIDAVMHKLIC